MPSLGSQSPTRSGMLKVMRLRGLDTKRALVGLAAGGLVASWGFSVSPANNAASVGEPAAVMSVAAMNPSEVEQALVDLTNRERTSAGLAPLVVDNRVRDVAAVWTQTMLDRGDLSHNPTLQQQMTLSPASDWRVVGENVGYAPTVKDLHQAFMDSPDHADNILHDEFTRISVAAMQHPDGGWWVTVLFWAP